MTLTKHIQPLLDKRLPAVLSCMSPSLAQDHLVPESSILGDDEFAANYQQRVREVFNDAYDRSVKARLIEEPSFSPERAIFLRKDDDAWSIVALTPAVQLWAYEGLNSISKEDLAKIPEAAAYAAKVPKDYRDIKIARCSVALELTLAERIRTLWIGMLLDTRFARGPEYVVGPDGKRFDSVVMVTDGTLYHFSAFADDFLAGQAHSPMSGTKAAALVDVADTMADYCEKKTPALLASLDKQVSRLQARIEGPDK